jgi:hypothetical protein
LISSILCGDVTPEFEFDFIDNFGGSPSACVIEFAQAARRAGNIRRISCRLFIGEHGINGGRGTVARGAIINLITN